MRLTSGKNRLNYQVVEMTADDIEQVALLERGCFSNPWPKESFRHDLSDPRAYTLVAKEGETVLGYLIAYLLEEELQIANIAVRPEYRRRGIGGSLLTRALSAGKQIGCQYAILEVRASNLAAAELYYKFNFRLLGERPRYYTSPTEAALVMRKNLGAQFQS